MSIPLLVVVTAEAAAVVLVGLHKVHVIQLFTVGIYQVLQACFLVLQFSLLKG